MSARCEPPEELRGVDGWHWVQASVGEPHLAKWFAAPNRGIEPLWDSDHHIYTATPSCAAREWGLRYLAPVATSAEVDEVRAEVNRMKAAASTINEEVCQTLGKVLGYPWFKDDLVNFPHSTEAHGVCVGDHVAESIAAEAAERIKTLRAEVERLRGALERIADDITVIEDAANPDNWPANVARAALARAALTQEPGDEG